jgi:peptidoglycan/LPS O-acetylase OafA/YrhL
MSAVDIGHGTGYRADVDGLRAVAVLAVLAFHLKLPWTEGGFVGVDIFFVISGFVIYRGILQRLDQGDFSLGDFYRRRARRILPALFTVLVATLIAGLFILAPREMEELAESALASLFFGANFFFHDRTNSSTSSPRGCCCWH